VSKRRDVHLQAEVELLETLVSDILEYQLGTKNPLVRHACQKWTGILWKRIERLKPAKIEAIS
jgi:hypothetical protein